MPVARRAGSAAYVHGPAIELHHAMSSPAGCSMGEALGAPGPSPSPSPASRQPPQRVPSAPGELTPLARGLSCLFRATGSGLGSGLGQEPAAGGTGPSPGLHAGLDARRASQGGASECSSCGPALAGERDSSCASGLAHKARRHNPVRASVFHVFTTVAWRSILPWAEAAPIALRMRLLW